MTQINPLFIVFAAAAAFVLIGELLRRRRRRNLYTYTARSSLCTPAELHFLKTLDAAIDPSHRVFAMVRLGDVLVPKSREWTALNRISMKHLDFVVCDRETSKPLYAIELNDSSHSRPDRKERDTFIADAMRSAGIPLLFYKVQRSYNMSALRLSIENSIQATPMQSRRRLS